MRTLTQSDSKCVSLSEHATLNPHPELVSNALFQTHPFFDPCDLVQVKYEMLRRVMVEGHPVGTAAAAFGFSRVTWYQLRQRFASEGLAGLLPQHKGPRRASKLSDEILSFILQALKAEPELRTTDLPQRIAQQFGFSVHLRSIERALARRRKKAWPLLLRQMGLSRLLPGRCPNAWNDMKPCAARH